MNMFYLDSQIKTILVCDICKDIFSDPRVLPCGRTFCNDCIAQSSNSKFKCLCEKKVI